MNAHDKEAAERERFEAWFRDRHKIADWAPVNIEGTPTESQFEAFKAGRAALSSPAEAGGKAQPFAYFQINPGWNTWEEVTPAAAGEDGVEAAYLAPPTAQSMTFEEICLLICQHTGKRINIPVDQIEDMADLACAIESNHSSSTTTVSITPTASSSDDL